MEDQTRALRLQLSAVSISKVQRTERSLEIDLCSQVSLIQTRCGVNGGFKRPESESSLSYTRALNSTRLGLNFSDADTLESIVATMRTSEHLDDVVPQREDALEPDDLDAAPEKWDPEAKKLNETLLGVMQFATLGVNGVDTVFDLFQQALRDFLGLEMDLSTMRLVACDATAQEPFLGSRDKPCKCTSCSRNVFIEMDEESPLVSRWCLFAEDVSPRRDGVGTDHYQRFTPPKGAERTLLIDDRARDTRFGGLHHAGCTPSNMLQMEHLLVQKRVEDARKAALESGCSAEATAAATRAAAAHPTLPASVDAAAAAADAAAAAARAQTEEEQRAAAGAASMETDDEPPAGAAAGTGAGDAEEQEPEEEQPQPEVRGPPYICAVCFKSLKTCMPSGMMRPHTIRNVAKAACEMGAALPALSEAEAAQRDREDPEGILQRRVRKDFGAGLGIHEGDIIEFHRTTGYRVNYQDEAGEDEPEDYGILEIREILIPIPSEPRDEP